MRLLAGLTLVPCFFASADETPAVPAPAEAPQIAAASPETRAAVAVPASPADADADDDAKAQPVPAVAEKAVAAKKEDGEAKGLGERLDALITKSCEEREARMLALHEAMLKLRAAGSEEEAKRLEKRLRAMVETHDPREDDGLLANKTELESLRSEVEALSRDLKQLTFVLEQNSRIMDEILRKAVPEVSAGVVDEMRHQSNTAQRAKDSKGQEVRKP